MGLWKRLLNALTDADVKETADLNDEKLLQWLGIDPTRPEAISEATYFACIKILSETMGKLPLKYYAEDPNGGRVRASPDSSVRMLMERPNELMTPATFWSTLEANCEHYGNSYAWMQRKFVRHGRYGGDYVTLGYWPMQSDCVEVLMDDVGVFGDKGQLYYRYTDPKSGQEYVFRQDNVLHFKTWLTWDGIMGKAVRDILKGMVGGAGYSQKYLEKLYESGLTASSVLQYTGDLEEKLRKQLQKKYNDLLTGARNAGKVVALPVGMTLTPLSYKLTDAQFLELRRYSALQIAAAFGVKPNHLNDYEKSSYANSETQQLAFLTDTMLFRLAMYEQEITYKVLTDEQRAEGKFFKFNEKALLRADAETQMRTIVNGVQNAIYTPNEGRHLLDMPDRDGGDVLMCNGNYVPVTQVGAAYGVRQEGGNEDDSEN